MNHDAGEEPVVTSLGESECPRCEERLRAVVVLPELVDPLMAELFRSLVGVIEASGIFLTETGAS